MYFSELYIYCVSLTVLSLSHKNIFYYQPCTDWPVTNSLMLYFEWTVSRHVTTMILIDYFLLQIMITCKELLSIELHTSCTHSSSVVPWIAVTPRLTAKLISFLVNRDAYFLVLSLPEFTQPAFHFMLVFICAIYFVITLEFSNSSFLAEGEQLPFCPLSMNSLHLLSNKLYCWILETILVISSTISLHWYQH